MSEDRRRASFLLRLWREDENSSAWRASLEDAATGERKGFVDVKALAEYLHSLVREPDSKPSQPKEKTA
jgi:predicted nucleic acid-binding protein